MSNLRCFKHPSYSGQNSPVLACKICCSIYISTIKEEQEMMSAEEKRSNVQEWLENKEKLAKYVSSQVNK